MKPKFLSIDKITLSTVEGIYFVNKTNIVRVEAMSNYSTFYLQDNKKIIISKSLSKYDHVLQDHNFLRVSRSVIVNMDYVVKYRRGDGGILEMHDGTEVNVSSSRKNALMQIMAE